MCLVAAASGGKEKAVDNFQKAIQLAGANSELGIEAAGEVEKANAKSGMCFIATAVYGSNTAPEVSLFRDFRDEVLISSRLGSLFVELYYLVSPPIAWVISKSEVPKLATRYLILVPLLALLKGRDGNTESGSRKR